MAETCQIIPLRAMAQSELEKALQSEPERDNLPSPNTMAQSEPKGDNLSFVITFHNDGSNKLFKPTSTTAIDLTDALIDQIIEKARGCPICHGKCCRTQLAEPVLSELGVNELNFSMAVDNYGGIKLFVSEQEKMPEMEPLIERITQGLQDAQSAVTSV